LRLVGILFPHVEEYIILYYIIIYKVCLPHVSAILVVILREVHYKGCIAQVFEPLRKCEVLSVAETYRRHI